MHDRIKTDINIKAKYIFLCEGFLVMIIDRGSCLARDSLIVAHDIF